MKLGFSSACEHLPQTNPTYLGILMMCHPHSLVSALQPQRRSLYLLEGEQSVGTERLRLVEPQWHLLLLPSPSLNVWE